MIALIIEHYHKKPIVFY